MAVSLIRARNVYPVFEERPAKVGESCHVPVLNLYSAPEIVLSVMLFAVTFAAVGAVGAVCVSFDVKITALAGLSGEALCVAVSLIRARNVYPVFEERPVKVGESCHVPVLNLYSAPDMVFNVILFVVTLAAVGASGAAGVALFAVMVKSIVNGNTIDVGVLRFVYVPSPSWPEPLLPQAQRLPLVFNASV